LVIDLPGCVHCLPDSATGGQQGLVFFIWNNLGSLPLLKMGNTVLRLLTQAVVGIIGMRAP
jgi:hypothetical protein